LLAGGTNKVLRQQKKRRQYGNLCFDPPFLA
jgi:hypothetical protein